MKYKLLVALGIATILFLAAASSIILWIVVSSDYSKSFDDVKENYLSYYPSILQNARLLTAIHVLMLCLSGFLYYKSSKQVATTVSRKILIGLTGLIFLLALWQLFTLM